MSFNFTVFSRRFRFEMQSLIALEINEAPVAKPRCLFLRCKNSDFFVRHLFFRWKSDIKGKDIADLIRTTRNSKILFRKFNKRCFDWLVRFHPMPSLTFKPENLRKNLTHSLKGYCFGFCMLWLYYFYFVKIRGCWSLSKKSFFVL